MIEVAAVVRELVLFNFKLLEDRNEQVAQRSPVAVVAFEAMVFSVSEATTGKQDG